MEATLPASHDDATVEQQSGAHEDATRNAALEINGQN